MKTILTQNIIAPWDGRAPVAGQTIFAGEYFDLDKGGWIASVGLTYEQQQEQKDTRCSGSSSSSERFG